ncbi:apolipoprotein A-I-like [Pempheris klunzingeri]|uniref:apolipoprotein A-I-like n=1 Tax=Pempheris klunzingeri TaxID=3127111 RepID=UPI00397FA0DF
MKFVTLALALLLAVGSQAASLQADAPSDLEHIRASLDMFLGQVKDSALKALSSLDDTEYKELKESLSQHIETGHTQLKALQGKVSPMTDSVVATITDATADMRTAIVADIETMKTQIGPQFDKVKEVVTKHIDEYRTMMQPIVTEYQARHTAEMEKLKTQLEPLVEQLRAKVATNVEETKTAMMPVVEGVREKIIERLETVKTSLVPYLAEYKEQMQQYASSVPSMSADEMKKKFATIIEELKTKIQPFVEG